METLGVAVGEVDAATEPAGDGVAASVAVGVGVGVGVVVPHAPTAAASRSVATAATRAEERATADDSYAILARLGLGNIMPLPVIGPVAAPAGGGDAAEFASLGPTRRGAAIEGVERLKHGGIVHNFARTAGIKARDLTQLIGVLLWLKAR